MDNKPSMFCYQCQETAHGKGCELQGVCGKHADTSARMDLLLYAVRGIAIINRAFRDKGVPDREASHFVIDALFTTITNANFDNDSLDGYIRRAFELKNLLAGTAKKRGIELPDLPQVEFFATANEADKCEAFTGVLAEPRLLHQVCRGSTGGLCDFDRRLCQISLHQTAVGRYRGCASRCSRSECRTYTPARRCRHSSPPTF